MIITHETDLYIPKDYKEGDTYNSIPLVMPGYVASNKRTTNKFRQGARHVR